jgi:hypothetical protein
MVNPLHRDSEKPLTSSGMAPSDDIDEGEDADEEDEQLSDLQDEIDSTSASFFEDYSMIFGEGAIRFMR